MAYHLLADDIIYNSLQVSTIVQLDVEFHLELLYNIIVSYKYSTFNEYNDVHYMKKFIFYVLLF